MKSKITIDVDWDNQPIIKIEHEDSPDVRDKLVKNFMLAFGGQSCWADFHYNTNFEGPNATARLRPIEPYKLHEHLDQFTSTANKNKFSEAEKHENISVKNET